MSMVKLAILAAAVIIVAQMLIGLVSDHGAAAHAHAQMVQYFGVHK